MGNISCIKKNTKNYQTSKKYEYQFNKTKHKLQKIFSLQLQIEKLKTLKNKPSDIKIRNIEHQLQQQINQLIDDLKTKDFKEMKDFQKLKFEYQVQVVVRIYQKFNHHILVSPKDQMRAVEQKSIFDAINLMNQKLGEHISRINNDDQLVENEQTRYIIYSIFQVETSYFYFLDNLSPIDEEGIFIRQISPYEFSVQIKILQEQVCAIAQRIRRFYFERQLPKIENLEIENKHQKLRYKNRIIYRRMTDFGRIVKNQCIDYIGVKMKNLDKEQQVAQQQKIQCIISEFNKYQFEKLYQISQNNVQTNSSINGKLISQNQSYSYIQNSKCDILYKSGKKNYSNQEKGTCLQNHQSQFETDSISVKIGFNQ